MTGLLIIIGIFIVPIFVGGWIAKSRNRNKNKGQIVGALSGWLGVLILYMALKSRGKRPDGTFYFY